MSSRKIRIFKLCHVADLSLFESEKHRMREFGISFLHFSRSESHINVDKALKEGTGCLPLLWTKYMTKWWLGMDFDITVL